MVECDTCGTETTMPYECRHCNGTYCAEHRLPEAHDCPGLKQWEQQGPVFDSGFDDSVGNPGSNGIADRLGIDTGPGGTLAYFRGNMTYVFLGLMWVVFAAQLALSPLLEQSTLDAIFVFSPENPLYVWTWITSVFAHGGFTHILVNSLVVFFFGPAR